MTDYSTHHVSKALVDEILQALRTVNHYGSIEIYVQNSVVTQITIRNIKKTSVSINHANASEQKIAGSVSVISHMYT